VAEALVKAGACDCYSLSRAQMLAELEAVLGTTTRDDMGDKVEVRGLTEKEMEFFIGNFDRFGSTAKTLDYMASDGPNEGAKTLSQMSKAELSELAAKLGAPMDPEAMKKPTRRDLEAALRKAGYTPPKKATANEARRAIIGEKAQALGGLRVAQWSPPLRCAGRRV
jgi:DNA polymerase III alpha subunit